MKKWIRKMGIFIFSILFIASAALLFIMECSDGGNVEQYKKEPGEDLAPEELVENPIDWDKLKDKDVYAWVNVPGTRIDYPVASAPEDKEEDYYLHRNLKGHYDFAGMIYSRRANSRDFSDPVTVLYGHNMRNGAMFGSLKRFEDKKFFDRHESIYIYMPGKIYTYQIVSASQSDNRDLLSRYDYQNPDGMTAYVNEILMPASGNIRPDISVPAGSHFLVLSTCSTGSAKRRLVQAVLQETKDTK